MSTIAPPPRNTVQLLADGPLELRGDLRLRGEPIGTEAWLCRCGQSRNKPHCDGSHRTSGCALPGECTAREATLDSEGGVLEIEPRPNGPYRPSGNLVVLNARGEVIDRLTQAVLCRCGRSKKKPWCDGSHRTARFVAP
jgi:CDGSH-type Zn-finger protein